MTNNFKLLLEEARALDLDVDIIYPEKELVTISRGSRKIFVKEVFSIANDPCSASSALATNKELAYRIWEREGIPFPRNYYFKNAASFPKNASDLHLTFPVIFKKSNGKKSIGAHPNILSFEDLKKIVGESTGSFIIQEMVFGREYRLLVNKDRLLGALEHVPPQVIGDGVRTVAALAKEKSALLRAKIVLNDKVIKTLQNQKLTPDSIPKKGVLVLLQATACLSEGATSVDCTDIVHADIVELAKKSARVLNMKLAGIDLICEDISTSPEKQQIAFLEINTSPSLSIHYTPMVGKSRRVIKEILEEIFNLQPAR